MEQGEIRRWASVRHTMKMAGRELPGSVRAWLSSISEWHPDVVVTDFEPLSGIYSRWYRVPLVCVDNIHMISRCRHDKDILEGARDDYLMAAAVAKAMVPPAGDYIVTTFFQPPLARGRTTLVAPIIRPAVTALEPTRGEHLLVYSDGSDALIEALRESGLPCRVYGMRDGPLVGTTDGLIEFRPRSTDGFLADLASARGVITGGGFSLLSEAVYLRKPTLSVPLRGQFEQLMNARYLEREGYGLCAEAIHGETLGAFLERLDEYQEKLEGYVQNGNDETLGIIEEHVTTAAGFTSRERARARRAARSRQKQP
jgi:uncharacterized protein (TIGR00661 family)